MSSDDPERGEASIVLDIHDFATAAKLVGDAPVVLSIRLWGLRLESTSSHSSGPSLRAPSWPSRCSPPRE